MEYNCNLPVKEFQLQSGIFSGFEAGCKAVKFEKDECKEACCAEQSKWCKEQDGDPRKCVSKRGCTSKSNYIQNIFDGGVNNSKYLQRVLN